LAITGPCPLTTASTPTASRRVMRDVKHFDSSASSASSAVRGGT
jgi:hypothetical protein